MNNMPIREGDAHVRLTNQAYALLIEVAEDYNVSQKEIASEAIIALVKKENIMKDATLTIRKLRKTRRDIYILLVTLGVLFGIAFSLVVGLFLGVF